MMKKAVIEFYGSEVCPSEYPLLISCSCLQDPAQCKDYGRIISTRHYQLVATMSVCTVLL